MIVPHHWKLPEAVTSRLGQTTFGRQRSILEEGHLVLVLHRPPKADESKREGVLVWRKPNGDWEASIGGGGQAVLRKIVQSYVDLEAKLSEQYEKANDTTALFDLLESLTPLARAARNMHLALQSAREAVKEDRFILEMRDLAYEAERNLELLLEDVRNALQYRAAREAEITSRQSMEALRASHRLNILAALFFPVTAVASIFGMNLYSGIENRGTIMFFLVLLVSIALGLAMKSWVLAKPDTSPPPSGGEGSARAR